MSENTTRAYLTTTVPGADAVFRDGFTDLYEEFGRRGVYLATVPLGANDGFDGDVTLCLDVPPDVFQRHDVTDELQEASGYRLALVPADVLNRLGRPQVYDHTFAGASRRELVQSIRTWEEGGPKDEGTRRHVQAMRDAMAFFDRIGWLTPLKQREEGGA
jgi:hypothetical protein